MHPGHHCNVGQCHGSNNDVDDVGAAARRRFDIDILAGDDDISNMLDTMCRNTKVYKTKKERG